MPQIDWAELNKSMRDTIRQQLLEQSQQPQSVQWIKGLYNGDVESDIAKRKAAEWEAFRRGVAFIKEASSPMPALKPPVDLLAPEAKASLERINAKHRQEHMWNMIVLAAQSSRDNP
jgi:hypothetical protein